MNIIELNQLNKSYADADNQLHVLKDLSLTIKPGEFVAIMGPSGCGKSTLMNILGCLDSYDSGNYRLYGKEITDFSANDQAKLRSKNFGFIFQRYNLLSNLTALDNVILPAIYAGTAPEQRQAKAKQLLEALGLGTKLNNKPNELSGGEQQRVCIARALVNGAEIIFADEPTGALDSINGIKVLNILKQLHQQGLTVVLVTHDANIASHADRIIRLKDGVMLQDELSQTATTAVVKSHSPWQQGFAAMRRKDQLFESVKMALQAILSHRMRSLLTMLGIIIGIASVTTVVALGKGSQQKILDEIKDASHNTIMVFPGSGFGDRRAGQIKTLTVADARALQQQDYIENAEPNMTLNGLLVYQNEAVNVSVSGVGARYFKINTIKLMQGRYFNATDLAALNPVVIIDANTYKKLFRPKEKVIGKKVIYQNNILEIIGVAHERTSGFGRNSLNLWVPYSTAMTKLSGQQNINSVIIKVKDEVNLQQAQARLTQLLKRRHNGNKDFFIWNAADEAQTFTSVTNSLTLLVVSIAFISLVVGGIGVMNIMLVSVSERIREIGLRMAIGATKTNILEQFLIEAGIICLIGGAIGLWLSYSITLFFNLFATDFVMDFSLTSAVIALACSSVIGLVFGFMPARKAAQLKPIEALADA